MSISQLIAQTLMTFKADTSQARAEIKALQGAEKDAAKTTLEGIEKRNSAYESLAKGITKANAVLAVANEALKIGGEAFKAYEENQRLSIAAANTSIGDLRASSQGLRTDLDLLKLAAAGNAATFKSNQQQLENAAAAMVAFERAGFDAGKSTEKVREAILKGNVEPLKELGINLDAAKTKQEQFAQLQTVLAQKAREAGEGHAAAGESFKRAAVEYDNAMRDIKVALGELVAGLAPLISALASAVGLIADVVGAAGSAIGSLHDGATLVDNIEATLKRYMTPEMLDLIAKREASQKAERDRLAADFGGIGPDYGMTAGQRTSWDAIGNRGARVKAKNDAYAKQLAESGVLAFVAMGIPLDEARRMAAWGGNKGLRDKRKGGEYNFGGTDNQDREFGSSAQYLGSVEQRDTAGRPIGFSTDFGGGSFGGGSMPDPRGMDGAADSLSKLAADLRIAGGQSALAKMFGPISEFDAYAQAFGMLTGAAQAGFSAWIDGSMSASAAIKKFFADSLKGVATEMLGKAIQHGAYALGSLAFGDAKGAAQHGIAAAKFGAGALAVGALAKMAGGGGASAGASAGAGGGAPSVIGSGGGGSIGGGSRTYIVGDAWHSGTERKRNRDIARAVRLSEQSDGGERSVRVG